VLELLSVRLKHRLIEFAQQSKALRRDHDFEDAAIVGLPLSCSQSALRQPVDEPRDIGVAIDHPIRNIAASQTLFARAPQNPQDIVGGVRQLLRLQQPAELRIEQLRRPQNADECFLLGYDLLSAFAWHYNQSVLVNVIRISVATGIVKKQCSHGSAMLINQTCSNEMFLGLEQPPALPFIVEIKARCMQQAKIRSLLKERPARFLGEDHQVDTYFRVPQGRLKLREGTIEQTLIYYDRADQQSAKASRVAVYEKPGAGLKVVLTQALGVLAVVDKRREIYFIDNVKVHLDRVEGLGTFVEIEAIDEEGTIGETRLREQCEHYMALFEIAEDDLVGVSYSDMLLRQR
jgi:predicted adenylyl cyclase CyaB